MSDYDKNRVKSYPTVVIDSPKLLVLWPDGSSLSLLAPGVHSTTSVKIKPVKFVREKIREQETVEFTENLLQLNDFIACSTNKYTRYLSAMRPTQSVTMLPEKKTFNSLNSTYLCASLPEFSLVFGNSRPMYYAPMGKTFSCDDVVKLKASCHLNSILCSRVIYRAPVSVFWSNVLSNFPGAKYVIRVMSGGMSYLMTFPASSAVLRFVRDNVETNFTLKCVENVLDATVTSLPVPYEKECNLSEWSLNGNMIIYETFESDNHLTWKLTVNSAVPWISFGNGGGPSCFRDLILSSSSQPSIDITHFFCFAGMTSPMCQLLALTPEQFLASKELFFSNIRF